MDPVLLANLLIALSTNGIPLVLKIKQDIEAGRTATTVTDADLLEVKRLNDLDSAAIYAKAGVTPPPAAPAGT